MIRYINRRGDGNIDTVDNLDSNDFPDRRSFKKELSRLLSEYQLSDPSGEYYSSQRSVKDY